ncbi:hypothetical protein G9U51_14730 [Calidifontibacter sp. DB0510]|uniref:Lipoprotein n=1 Tax=Metallococcus carri TaxID=1656884 RepID=A0A967B2C5_9MICO|nr:hypothetical protein [Metallococcus carri]NHN57023.1 hypothetical protein [Metallococcus carri]NOP39108.1 hypothetical protein [Calidifontibacter sp. DB2511S]
MISRRTAISAAGVLGLAACSSQPGDGRGTSTGPARSGRSSSSGTSSSRTSSVPQATLPGGGRTIFPEHRLVGYCGLPGAPALGQLGVGNLSDEVAGMLSKIKAYAEPARPVLPVMELIACVVQPKPGVDGMWRARVADSIVEEWNAKAKEVGALLLLNIQPGRSTFLEEAKKFEKWLLEPHVGLALDPEWAIGPGQVPGREFGTTTGAAVDEVAAYLSGLVTANDLPQKALVVHVLRRSILTGEQDLRERTGVALVKSVDGIGQMKDKIKAYDIVMAGTPSFVRPGFKLFYDEDQRVAPLMTPAQVLALTPPPDYVLYE